MKIRIISDYTKQIETTTQVEYLRGEHTFMPGSSEIKFLVLAKSDTVIFQGEIELFNGNLSRSDKEELIKHMLLDAVNEDTINLSAAIQNHIELFNRELKECDKKYDLCLKIGNLKDAKSWAEQKHTFRIVLSVLEGIIMSSQVSVRKCTFEDKTK